jgi:hypothetical protein
MPKSKMKSVIKNVYTTVINLFVLKAISGELKTQCIESARRSYIEPLTAKDLLSLMFFLSKNVMTKTC